MADTATPAKTATAPAAPVTDAKPAIVAAPKTEPVKPVSAAIEAPKPAPTTAAPAPATPKVAAKPAAKTAPKPVVAKRKPATPTKKIQTTHTLAAKAAPAKKDTKMDAIKNTTAKAESMMADANQRTKAAVDKSQKMLGEMNDFSKGNIEAIVESSKIAAKGIEAMGQDAVAYAKASFEEATAAAKKLASVKSPTEFMKLQSDYARTSFDAMVAHTSKSTEAMLKLAGEIAQPISNRVSLAAEKVKIAA